MYQEKNKKKEAWERKEAARKAEIEECYKQHTPIQVVKGPKS